MLLGRRPTAGLWFLVPVIQVRILAAQPHFWEILKLKTAPIGNKTGFEAMRWNRVKKMPQWGIFSDSRDRACEGAVERCEAARESWRPSRFFSIVANATVLLLTPQGGGARTSPPWHDLAPLQPPERKKARTQKDAGPKLTTT